MMTLPIASRVINLGNIFCHIKILFVEMFVIVV